MEDGYEEILEEKAGKNSRYCSDYHKNAQLEIGVILICSNDIFPCHSAEKTDNHIPDINIVNRNDTQ